jgi:branched-chain amino acid transport system substrate-binding protein
MTEKKIKQNGITRRKFIKLVGSAGVIAAGTSLVPRVSRAATRDYILIGHPMSKTGPIAPFGEAAAFADEIAEKEINDAGGIYLKELGKKLPVKILGVDTESSPTKAAEIATKMILQDKVDIIVVASTPDTTNPTVGVSERYGVPCIGSVPYESFAPAGPFKWAFNYMWSVEQMADLFVGMWNEFGDKTNKVVGGVWPNDPDGISLAEIMPKKFKAQGYKVVDVGRHPYGMKDYSAFINTWKKEKVEILTGSPIPPDFAVLWRQCKQMGFTPKIATIAKACLFPSSVEALGGDLANGISVEIWWSPWHPYKSSISGITCRDMTDAWTAKTKKQWSQILGLDYCGIEIAVDSLKRAGSLDKEKIRQAVTQTDLDTIFGHIQFNDKNWAPTTLGGAQWIKGKKWPWNLQIVYNKTAPNIPITGKMIFPMPK